MIYILSYQADCKKSGGEQSRLFLYQAGNGVLGHNSRALKEHIMMIKI